jgi:gliding motility-associated-like protein
MRKRLLLSAFLLLSTTIGLAQKQNNQWRFGQGGGAIDFNSTNPVVLTVGATATGEGSASVADRNSGALLFYTDGVTVWNANNQPMPNGTGLTGGSPALLSSTAAAAIVPRPGNLSQYYIFTIDEQFSPNGLRHSLVDMTLAGGLGDIVAGSKNIPVYVPTSEKVQVVPHANGVSLWVLTHDFNNSLFVAFEVSASGVSTMPVISTAGISDGNGAGHMKVSRQFDKIAMGNTFNRTVDVFNFDNATGVVSNFLSWPTPFTGSPLLYGVEFSPDGSRLYVSNLEALYQYNLQAGNQLAVQNSAFLLTSSGQPAAIQLAPNHKIYISNGFLDVINCPNALGSNCNYQSNALPGAGGYGLPLWVYDVSDTLSRFVQNRILATDSCINENAQFALLDTSKIQQVNWDFGDPTSGLANQAVGFQAQHIYNVAGSYLASARLIKDCAVDTLRLNVVVKDCNPPPPPLLTNIVLLSDSCNVVDDAIFELRGTSLSSYYTWSFGDTASAQNDTITTAAVSTSTRHTFSSAGTYTVCVRFQNPGLPQDSICRTFRVGLCPPNICRLFVANAFTPQGDGLNDVFKPLLDCTTDSYDFQIFNRWGQLVFSTNDPNTGWDGSTNGQVASEGVYFYSIQYKANGKAAAPRSGSVMLIR